MATPPGTAIPGTTVPITSLVGTGGAQGLQGIQGIQGSQGPTGQPGLSGAQEVGSVKAWPSVTPPATWLIMDGSAVSRTLYPQLFSLIGTTFGAGDGATTFNLPDARSNFIIGAGQGLNLSNYTLGQEGGEETHLLTAGELASHVHGMDHYHLIPTGQFNHAHSISDPGHAHTCIGDKIGYQGLNPPSGNTAYPLGTTVNVNNTQAAGTGIGVAANTLPQGNTNYASQTNGAWGNTVASGGGGAHNNLPPFLCLVYIIKVSAGGGPTAQAPIADNTQPGLMKTLSGNPTDYVGGDNACHPIVGPSVVFLSAARQLTLNDNNTYFICSGGSWTLSIPAPTAGVSYRVRNDQDMTVASATIITITPPSGLINGKASLSLLACQECTILSDGTNWRTFGLQREVVVGSLDIAAAQPNVSFQLPDGYTHFDIRIAKIFTTAAQPAMQVQLSNNRGTSWIASANYYGTYTYNSSATALTTTTYTSSTIWYWTHWMDNSLPRHYADIRLFPGDAVGCPSFVADTGAMWQSGWTGRFDLSGFFNAAGRVNAVNMFPTSGNYTYFQMVVKGIY